MSAETIIALVRAAHARGLRTVAHTLTRTAARQAIDCGVDGLAHAPANGSSDPELVEAAARAGVFVVPTLTALAGMTSAPVEFRACRRPEAAALRGPAVVEGAGANPYRRPGAASGACVGGRAPCGRRRRADVPGRCSPPGRHGRHGWSGPSHHARHQLPRRADPAGASRAHPGPGPEFGINDVGLPGMYGFPVATADDLAAGSHRSSAGPGGPDWRPSSRPSPCSAVR
jgi:hypothetical protein